MNRRCVIFAVIVLLGGGTQRGLSQDKQSFDHWQHRNLFPSCVSCHAGVQESDRPLWPAAAACADCHDGTVEKRVDWQPPPGPPRTNLRFTHNAHATAVREAVAADSVLGCESCHSERDRMRVRLAVVQSCLDCHRIQTAHLSAPDSSCSTCHVPLARASRLTPHDVAEFPVPDSHKQRGFAFSGHAKQAGTSNGTIKVSAACATCHARDFCIQCHVNAPEVPLIQALALDSRSTAIEAELEAPADHRNPEFLFRHGEPARTSPATCATCHTQESCLACHFGKPAAVQVLPVAGPGRGKGASTERERPASHGRDFSEIHGPVANARPQSCEGCHVRPQCLDCHRPNPADPTPGYHPAGFLSRHPAAAYTRETSCSDCHNAGQFCADCHVKAGLAAQGPLDAGYHDAKQFFLLNHGQAARQNLESCVTCHAERDCLSCHSAQGGRRFNPHGPGFDPETLRRKNSQACTVCHGAAIPGGD
jgi:Doubled CXXCH motif (Paired_CXXCH_1)